MSVDSFLVFQFVPAFKNLVKTQFENRLHAE